MHKKKSGKPLDLSNETQERIHLEPNYHIRLPQSGQQILQQICLQQQISHSNVISIDPLNFELCVQKNTVFAVFLMCGYQNVSSNSKAENATKGKPVI